VLALAAYSLSSVTRPSESLVFAALRIVVTQHRILSAIPVNEHTNKPYFARLPHIDLRTYTQFIEWNKPFSLTEAGEVDSELEELLESQHDSIGINVWKQDLSGAPLSCTLLVPRMSSWYPVAFTTRSVMGRLS